MRYQQNVRAIGIALIVIIGIRTTMTNLRLLLPKILTAIDAVETGKVIEVRPS